MVAGADAHPDPGRRYWAAVISGFGYVMFGLFAGITTAFVSLAPAILIEAVAGLALIAAFTGSALAAFSDEKSRLAAAVTFLAAASGMSLFGVSGAFWGLRGGHARAGAYWRQARLTFISGFHNRQNSSRNSVLISAHTGMFPQVDHLPADAET
jgi:predicted benzoate:H+ symporter BenE